MSVITQWQGSAINPLLPKFLDLIGFSEGTSTDSVTHDDGYDCIVTGIAGPATFSSYVMHPFAAGRMPVIVRENPPLRSTAAGRYQFILSTWQYLQTKLKLMDFSPLSQDLGALELIHERGAILDIEKGEIELAIGLCSNIWASFPGNSYGQGGKRIDALMEQWEKLNQQIQLQ